MTIDDLSETEIGMLAVALKYWRANRPQSMTRRTDPPIGDEAVELLLAKLDHACLSKLPPDRDVIFQHHLLHSYDRRKRN